jgi:hypothetical protein
MVLLRRKGEGKNRLLSSLIGVYGRIIGLSLPGGWYFTNNAAEIKKKASIRFLVGRQKD